MVKSALEDIITYGERVNKACEDSEFENMKLDDLKCPIFICGLQDPEFSDIKARLLSRIGNATPEIKVNMQSLMVEFQRLINLKARMVRPPEPGELDTLYDSEVAVGPLPENTQR